MTDRAEPGDPLDLDQLQERARKLRAAVFHVSEPVGGEHWEFEQDALHRGDVEQAVASLCDLTVQAVASLRDARQRVQRLQVENDDFREERWEEKWLQFVDALAALDNVGEKYGDGTLTFAERVKDLAAQRDAESRIVMEQRAALAAAAEREEKLVGVLMSARKVAGRAYGRACADGCDSDSAHDVSMEALSEHVDAALSPTPTEPPK